MVETLKQSRRQTVRRKQKYLSMVIDGRLQEPLPSFKEKIYAQLDIPPQKNIWQVTEPV